MTFFLVFVVFATLVDARGAFNKMSSFAIGLTISVGVLFGGPFTGAAINPAQSFRPGARRALLEQPRRLLGRSAAGRCHSRCDLRPSLPLRPATALEVPEKPS